MDPSAFQILYWRFLTKNFCIVALCFNNNNNSIISFYFYLRKKGITVISIFIISIFIYLFIISMFVCLKFSTTVSQWQCLQWLSTSLSLCVNGCQIINGYLCQWLSNYQWLSVSMSVRPFVLFYSYLITEGAKSADVRLRLLAGIRASWPFAVWTATIPPTEVDRLAVE